MKKTLILGLLCAGLISACNRDKDCVTCSNKATTWSDGEITITVPNVFTPANFSTCDSMVYSTVTETYMEPSFNYPYLKTVCTKAERKETPELCPCLENPDAKYNDTKNNVLKIIGIEQCKYNTFIVLKNGQEVAKIENYDNQMNVFNGYYIDTTSQPVKGKHLTGKYDFRLCIYPDAGKTSPITTMNGAFTIIRTEQSCEATGCSGVDSEDPLLTK